MEMFKIDQLKTPKENSYGLIFESRGIDLRTYSSVESLIPKFNKVFTHNSEYLKKYGLNKVLANLEAKSDPPNSAAVLNQHMQTFLASLQAHYAGALGFGFLNIINLYGINKRLAFKYLSPKFQIKLPVGLVIRTHSLKILKR
jgi:hypothetical protein